MSALSDRIGTQWPQSAGAFLGWWGRSLAAWLPAGMRRVLGVSGGRLLIAAAGPSWEMWRELDHGREVIRADDAQGALPRELARLPRWLVLPAESCLRRRLVLPAAAAHRLRDVVSFEIDRQTPFEANEVMYDARIAETLRDGRIVAELVVVPRQAVQARLTSIGDHAQLLAGVDVADRSGAPLHLNLLPSEQRYVHQSPARALEMGLAAAIALLLGLVMWQALDGRRQRAVALERVVETRLLEARKASIADRQLREFVAGQAFLDKERKQQPEVLAVIDELSRRIPDHTQVESLTMDRDQLTLTGLSGDASSLVGHLADSTLWRDAALTGSVQPDPATQRDRFTLVARMAGGGDAAD